jgi:hypothetical protein
MFMVRDQLVVECIGAEMFIMPDYSLPLLDELPPYPRNYHSSRTRDSETLEKLQALLARLEACRSRSEFESIVGKAKFARKGDGFMKYLGDGTTLQPDRVERYELDWCTVDVWFLKAQVVVVMGGL